MKTNTWPDCLYLNFRKYTFETILQNKYLSESLNESEKQCLDFCQEWLSGKAVFMGQTSGSTGKPKPIKLQRARMEASALATAQALDLKPGDKSLVCIPTHYIGGQMMLVRGLVLGLELHIIEPVSNPFKIYQKKYDSIGFHVDFTALVPLQLQTMLDESPESINQFLNPMKAILVGGAPVSEALHRQIQAVKSPMYHTYGMTETVSHIALKKLNGADATEYFFTLDQVEIAQDDQECLRIKAPQTGGVWIQTRDRVKITAKNRFEWLGRVDFVINTGGVKVQGEYIEQCVAKVLDQLQIQRDFFVYGLPHASLGQELCLVLEGDSFSKDQELALKTALKENLKKYEIPRKIFYLDQFIRTETSKIQKEASLQKIMTSF
ncbi:MAG: AMP-binding protein [Microscillaceae bacterium]|nr:AMP-binding protein [Microscillaceae bacterium]